MESDDIDDATRTSESELLKNECETLLSGIQRLCVKKQTLDDRVQNVKNLVYASTTVEDSKSMMRLSFITMIFLPATFSAHFFGMNVVELNPGGHTTLARFFEAAIPLTLFTIWVLVGFQSHLVLRDDRSGSWKKLLWPIVHFSTLFPRPPTRNNSLMDDVPLRRESMNYSQLTV